MEQTAHVITMEHKAAPEPSHAVMGVVLNDKDKAIEKAVELQKTHRASITPEQIYHISYDALFKWRITAIKIP